MEGTIKKEHIIIAEETLKNVVSVIHRKQYSNIVKFVDDIMQDDIDNLRECIELQENIEIDEYGFKCSAEDEHSRIDYYAYDDNSGFAVEYELTSFGDCTNIVLQLEFIYSRKKLIKKWIGLDI